MGAQQSARPAQNSEETPNEETAEETTEPAHTGYCTCNDHRCTKRKKLPGFLKYYAYKKRLKSYKHWPISLSQKPKDLANAGFYYTGFGDHTICFNCNIGLRHWRKDKNIWEEHAAWSPRCSYLIKQKGFDYVRKISKQYSAVLKRQGLRHSDACTSLNLKIPKKEDESKRIEKPAQTKTKETNKEDNIMVCGICCEKQRSIIYLPCCHMFSCEDCGACALKCPVCRQGVKAFVKAYLS